MIVRFGMSENFPNYAPIDSEGQNVYSEETSTKIDKEIMKVI
jgi:ATP-dependent Zn protease